MPEQIRPTDPLPLKDVVIADSFWAPRCRLNREKTIPYEYRQLKETGRIDAFRLDWRPGQEPVPHIFWDSDVAKWVEAASYSLTTHPDPALAALLEEVVDLIVAAQQPDGYLNVHFTVVEPDKRWTNLRDWHELYCAGHLMEAAVAHYQATGKRTLLDAACRYADYIAIVFGRGPGQKRGYCGHPEIELALVKLYRLTQNKKYLELSSYFVDERGQQPSYFVEEARARQEKTPLFPLTHYQAHLPVRAQTEATGHAVRAAYLYSAMADLARERGDADLLAACLRLWENVTTQKMYLTGGIGSTHAGEAFTSNYDLPNVTAYAETCAAIGLVFWSHRLLQLDCDRRYADVMERALYNGVLSGLSLDGEKFFYVNPLASLGDHHRQGWYDCACCPPNLARLLASLGQYIYTQNETEACVHLYIQGSGRFQLRGREVRLTQETDYPWDGKIKIRLEPAEPTHFRLRLRLPGWCPTAELRLNGETVWSGKGIGNEEERAHTQAREWEGTSDSQIRLEKGYLRLEREWRPGEEVELSLAMPIQRLYAHPEVRQDAGCVALQRGPLVYCLEAVDNPVPLHRLYLPPTAALTATFVPDLLGGVVVIAGEALAAETSDWEGTLYRSVRPRLVPCRFQAIPYYAWDNRQPGAMRVWLPEPPA